MLKQIILEYVDSINALRDFVDSIKLRLEEHVNRVLNLIEEPYLTDRLEKLQTVLENLEQEKRNALVRKVLTDVDAKQELKDLLEGTLANCRRPQLLSDG